MSRRARPIELFDDLTLNFSEESVFMDVAAIEPGRDSKAMDQSIANCSVLLAIVGLEWLEAKDASGGDRCLDDPNDFVRIELASALRRDIPVIPVLVRGARMPHVDRLPDDLKDLAYRNAVELTHARWKSDVQVLLRALRPFMEAPSGAERGKEAEGRRQEATGAPPSIPASEAIVAVSRSTRRRRTREQRIGSVHRADRGSCGQEGGAAMRLDERPVRDGLTRDRIRGQPHQVHEIVPDLGAPILPQTS